MSGWNAIATALKEAQDRQEAFARGDYNKPRIMPIFLNKTAGRSATVSFIDNEPWAAKVHTLPAANGKGFTTRKCLGKNCRDCEAGDKPKFRAFFTVVDHRERSFTKRDGTVASVKDQVCYYECSPANADMLFQKLQKAMKKDKSIKGLSDVVVEIAKFGEGTATTTSYDIEARTDEYQVPEGAEPINFNDLFGVGDAPFVEETSKFD